MDQNAGHKMLRYILSRLLILIIIIYSLISSLTGCTSGKVTSDKTESRKIDSLIKVQKLDDKGILVTFGYDAISAINTKKGIVIIDAGISTGLTARYKKIIQEEFKRDDFIYVINTHGHNDHCRGNSVFMNSSVAGHVNCLQEMSGQFSDPEKAIRNLSRIAEDYEQQLLGIDPATREWEELFTQKIRYRYACNDLKNKVPVKQPDITFTDSMRLDFGDITLEMIYFGKCHSNSDILVHVPQIKTVFTGDLFSEYGRPGISDTLMTDKEKWERAVIWTEKRMNNIEHVIEGHGRILSVSDLKQFNSNILRRCTGEYKN